MSYNSQYTGQQAEELLQRASVIQTDGDAGKFLAGDGTYKEVNPGVQSYRVLTLNGTEPLKIGEKVQKLKYGYSAQSGQLSPSDLNVNEVFVFHAPILNNDSEQRTLDCIGIKFSENELDVVSTTMIGTTNDSAINHYVVNIYYDIAADEISYLIQDMNEIGKGGEAEYLDMSIFAGESGTLSDDDYQKVVSAYEEGIHNVKIEDIIANAIIISDNSYFYIYSSYNIYENDIAGLGYFTITVTKSNKNYDTVSKQFGVQFGGDGTKFLSDDGTYKAVSGGSDFYDLPYVDFMQSIAQGSVTQDMYNNIKSAVESGKIIRLKITMDTDSIITVLYAQSSADYIKLYNVDLANYLEITINSDYTASLSTSSIGNGVYVMSQSDITGSSIQEDDYNGLSDALKNKRLVLIDYVNMLIPSFYSSYDEWSGDIKLMMINDDRIWEVDIDGESKSIKNSYYDFVRQKVVTESQYADLGDTVNTDGVLYFITPDSN